MTDGQKLHIDRLRLKGCGYSKIAKEIGVSENIVKPYCGRNKTNIKAQESIAVCEQCEKSIDTSKRRARRFCSNACRSIWWNKLRRQKFRIRSRAPAMARIFKCVIVAKKGAASMFVTSNLVMRAVAAMTDLSNIQANVLRPGSPRMRLRNDF